MCLLHSQKKTFAVFTNFSLANVHHRIISLISAEQEIHAALSHNHHFKRWFELALIRAGYMLAQKGGYRKHCYRSAYKAVLLES